MTPYEEFKHKEMVFKPELRVSIYTDGQFCLNQPSYETYFKDYPAVIFYFDSAQGKVGIKPTRQTTKHSYPLRVDAGGRFALITGRAFLNYHRIDYRRSDSYAAKWNEKEGFLEFTLPPSRLRKVDRGGGYKRRYEDTK